MATDIITIIGHHLTISEIIDLPKQIDSSTEIKALWLDEIENRVEFGYTKEKLIEASKKKSYWDIEVDENVLLEFWKSNEGSQEDSLMYLNCYLHTFFGWLRIYRHTIQIILLPEHKYPNLFYYNRCKYILTFNRALAKQFGQNKLIYAADNGFSSSIVEDKAIEGFNFESLVAFGQTKFGIDSCSISEKITNMFFIDDISEQIDPFEDLSWDKCKGVNNNHTLLLSSVVLHYVKVYYNIIVQKCKAFISYFIERA